MALFWFICGILLIYGISRYNESNKLFWTLLVSFVGTFTAASIAITTCNSNKKNIVTNVSPTQLYVSTSNVPTLLADVSYDTTYDAPLCTSVTVSKDYYISKDVLHSSRVNNTLDKPPQTKQLCYNISILHKLNNITHIKNSS